jgi:tetratricopeptide (TPR) repeat protein
MGGRLLLAGLVALVPAPAFAYINAGFRSEQEYREHLRREEMAKVARATEAIRRNPRDPVAYYHRGRVYAAQRRPEQAVADFDRAIELDPKFARAYFRRGEVLWGLDQKARSMTDVEKATRLDPKHLEAQVYFAVHTDDSAKALRAARQACELTDYQNDICVELLACVYAERGDFDSAVRWQRKALGLDVFGVDQARQRLEDYRRHRPASKWGVYWYLVHEAPEPR